MAGICGNFSKEGDCVNDLFWETHYLQHRAQNYCGLALCNDGKIEPYTHSGILKEQFQRERRSTFRGQHGIGAVASDRQPISELSKSGGYLFCFDGNVINYQELKDKMLKSGAVLSGYNAPEEVKDTSLVSRIISGGRNFESGVENLFNEIQGDFAVVALAKEGIYAARGHGRKPLILGEKEGGYSVSSESNSFPNTGFKIVRDVEPGEVVFIDGSGIHTIKKFDVGQPKFGTFEWVYTAHPASTIDGKNCAVVRKAIGGALARRFPVKADIVSPIPNSGRWHAIGYGQESGINYEEVFVRFDYSDRSYTPGEQWLRNEEARTKLIPVEELINGKDIIVVDDSIVRGTQLLNRVKVLKELGAKKVHARIACPPLVGPCMYGKTTKKVNDCIARRMTVEDIEKEMGLDSLGYATIGDLEEGIGLPREKLCLECWTH